MSDTLATSLLSAAQNAQVAILADIDALVKIESYSYDKSDLDQALGFVERLLEERLGPADAVERHDGGQYGDALVTTYAGSAPGNVMLVGHYDTVWPKGTLDNWDSFSSIDEHGHERLSGPGIFDMKTGLV